MLLGLEAAEVAAKGVTPSIGPLKNISGSLDDAAALARNQPYGPNTNIFRRLPSNAQDAQALSEAQMGMGRNSLAIMHEATHYGYYNQNKGTPKQTENNDKGSQWEFLAFERFSYKDELNPRGMDKNETNAYFNNKLNEVNRIGMTLSPRDNFNRMAFSNSLKTQGQKGDPTVTEKHRKAGGGNPRHPDMR